MAQSSWHRKVTITLWKTPQQGKGKKYSHITAWVKLKEITQSETKHSRKMLRTVWFHLFDILEVQNYTDVEQMSGCKGLRSIGAGDKGEWVQL